ncbi:killer cell lectin-like receptor subfamily B member 1B allele C [Pleurodeles waltl]|uniref:killer cell lectin-like receptor subfamily B member 1B allele C n=1 Tax=Pleurodeles waltl TaxID=8319 RepID=UPI0037094562
MAGSVIYADLQLPDGSDPIHPPRHADRVSDVPQCPPWHRKVIQISGAGFFFFFLITIALGFLAFKYSQEAALMSSASDKQCENRELFNQETTDCTGAEPGCERCPKDWLLHGDICYYFSKDKEVKTWSRSHEDCSSRSSRMLVIKDQAELNFVHSRVNHHNPVWLGLFLACPDKTWTWVNGSILNSDWYQVTGTNEEGSCGATKKASIYSESCLTETHWICEKDAKRVYANRV